MLSATEHERYSRHILLEEVGEAGQLALKAARVLIVGAGGLGSPVAAYLVAAGVGTIGLVDDDVVELSNLHRQILFSEGDMGLAKVEAAARRIKATNSGTVVEIHHERLGPASAEELISAYDLVVDCSDNFATRYAINDACLLLGRPFVYGSIYRFEGQVSVFCQPGGPCYRCLFPEENAAVANCAEAGVVGVLAGVIGSLQATEALKLLLGIGESLVGRLLLYDALALDFRLLKLTASCSLFCSNGSGQSRDIAAALSSRLRQEDSRLSSCLDSGPDSGLDSGLESGLDTSVGAIVTREPVENCQSVSAAAATSISPAQLRQRLDSAEKLLLLDVRTLQENRAMRFRGSRLIAVDELESRSGEISSELPLVVYCRSGIRSRRAAQLLRSKGYEQVLNLSGGILAWYREFQDHLLESDVAIT
ncbi:MAG: molybdenum cofactor biosynthesis protein MoeB [Cyanobacteria bacterium PR.023]|nr:molybdenum cofactor biosynthesis protein MoeB [Cyanobacteria bacterium PR.023]